MPYRAECKTCCWACSGEMWKVFEKMTTHSENTGHFDFEEYENDDDL